MLLERYHDFLSEDSGHVEEVDKRDVEEKKLKLMVWLEGRRERELLREEKQNSDAVHVYGANNCTICLVSGPRRFFGPFLSFLGP